ncbi:MAG: ATP-binding cassette domain-containing protein, partial [Clostridia bacterium]|nr:ATP-binding cassette domain-containing protein [Clostridia bacterium]
MKKKAKEITPIETDEVVRIEKVTKQYGAGTMNCFTAVNKVSLTVKKGEFVAIVGTSGSGKST